MDDDKIRRLKRRRLRDTCNVFEIPEAEFTTMFRMSKDSFRYILDEIGPRMSICRSSAIPPILRLSAFLRFVAVGGYQNALGHEYLAPMCQANISKAINECLDLFEEHMCPKWIQFAMSEKEEIKIKQNFYEKFGIPGVIGCVDGTHIKIKTPNDARHIYYNKKLFYSINAMIVCDFDMVIRYVDATSPGSNSDADIWTSSLADEHLKSAYDDGNINTWLLGDSGYPLCPYLMTPYSETHHRYEDVYNTILYKARGVIDHCLAALKSRFRCLVSDKGLQYTPPTITKIINACCAMHNICIHYKDHWECMEEVKPEPNFEDAEDVASPEALEIRDDLAQCLEEEQ